MTNKNVEKENLIYSNKKKKKKKILIYMCVIQFTLKKA